MLVSGGALGDLLIRSYDFAMIEEMAGGGRLGVGGRIAVCGRRSSKPAAVEIIVCPPTRCTSCCADDLRLRLDVELTSILPMPLRESARFESVHGGAAEARLPTEQDIFRGRLVGHGLEVVAADEPDRTTVHRIIYEELVRGVVSVESKQAYLAVDQSFRGSRCARRDRRLYRDRTSRRAR